MAYGRHQSFYVKSNWINKGIKAVEFDSSLFNSTERYKELGIGKNMFISLKYWLESLNVVKSNSNKSEFVVTNFGLFIKRFDPTCEKNFTLNLLHYYLTLEKPINEVEISHTFYYLFNLHEKKAFTKEDLMIDIINWDSTFSSRITSDKTILKDIDCLVQTYTKIEKSHPEDHNVSTLAKLGLLKRSKDYFTKTALKLDRVSKEAFFYMLLRLVEVSDSRYLDLEVIENHSMSPGKIFNLSRIDIIDILEEMISENFPIVISRTNNLDTLSISSFKTSEAYIEECFIKDDLK